MPANANANAKNTVLREMEEAGFDGRPFCVDLEREISRRKKKDMSPRENRYYSYMKWACRLCRSNGGDVGGFDDGSVAPCFV